MSRQNKVNPGMYTQRGRLTQDDAARELQRQRSIGSQHTWQPVQKDARPRPESKDDPSGGAKLTSEDNTTLEATPVKVKAKAPKATTKATTAKRTAANSSNGKAKTSKATSARPAKSAARTTRTKTVARKAVLARNVGGGGPKPRPTATRRKS